MFVSPVEAELLPPKINLPLNSHCMIEVLLFPVKTSVVLQRLPSVVGFDLEHHLK